MRKVSIREFRANMAKELADLPFSLVKNGDQVAVVCTQSDHIPTSPGTNVCTLSSGSVHNSQISDGTLGRGGPRDFFRPQSKDQQTGKKVKK